MFTQSHRRRERELGGGVAAQPIKSKRGKKYNKSLTRFIIEGGTEERGTAWALA